MKVIITYDGKNYESFRDIKLIQGTKGFKINFQLKGNNDSVVDLTGFTTASLDLKNIIENTVKTINLTITVPSEGKLEWNVSETDTNAEGVYATEVTVSDATKTYKVQTGLLTIIKEL